MLLLVVAPLLLAVIVLIFRDRPGGISASSGSSRSLPGNADDLMVFATLVLTLLAVLAQQAMYIGNWGSAQRAISHGRLATGPVCLAIGFGLTRWQGDGVLPLAIWTAVAQGVGLCVLDGDDGKCSTAVRAGDE
jgi:preprotein translocase subunit SecG